MTAQRGIITDVKHFAVHDGDGIRTTVFFKGCPLGCVWCHNPECISFEKEEAFYAHKCVGCGECKRADFAIEDCLGKARILYGREVTVDELLFELLEDRAFYESSGGGVTLSGGECLAQADFCAELLKALKEAGISTAVDTCGCVSRRAFDAVLPFTDVFLYDIKAIDERVHKRCTGMSNALILENLRYIDGLGADIEIRIPFVSGYNDGEIGSIARFIAGLKGVRAIRLLPYHDLARSKYRALSIEDTMPVCVSSEGELTSARELLSSVTMIRVY